MNEFGHFLLLAMILCQPLRSVGLVADMLMMVVGGEQNSLRSTSSSSVVVGYESARLIRPSRRQILVYHPFSVE